MKSEIEKNVKERVGYREKEIKIKREREKYLNREQ